LLRISAWLPVIGSASLSLFWLALLVVLVVMISNNDNRLFYGLSSDARPWFFLVWIFLLATILMIIASILGWTSRYGQTWRRIYYSLLTLAALTIAVVITSWGMVTAPF
jgi:hypothetical protein